MIQKSIEALVSSLTKDERIIAVGLSSHPIPQKPDEGDIDLFIYCSVIPEDRERIALYPEIVKDHEQFQCSIIDEPIGNWPILHISTGLRPGSYIS